MSRTKTEIALDILPHLAQAAKERRKITYQELGAKVDYMPLYLGSVLDEIRDRFLLEHNLPRLDALVVNKASGEVGDSFYAGGRDRLTDEQVKELLDFERQKVYDFPRWDEIVVNLQRHYGGEGYLRSRGRQARRE